MKNYLQFYDKYYEVYAKIHDSKLMLIIFIYKG